MRANDAIECPRCSGLGLVRGKYAQKSLVYECPNAKDGDGSRLQRRSRSMDRRQIKYEMAVELFKAEEHLDPSDGDPAAEDWGFWGDHDCPMVLGHPDAVSNTRWPSAAREMLRRAAPRA
jgi:hypothetical protein